KLRRQRADKSKQDRVPGSLAPGRPVEAKSRVGGAGALEHGRGERAAFAEVREREVDPRRRAPESPQVVLEPKRRAAVDAQRLERRAAAQQRFVVRVDGRLVGIDDAAI